MVDSTGRLADPAVEPRIWEDEYLFTPVTGRDTNGRHWQAWLNLDNNAATLLVEEPEDVDDVSLWLATPEFEASIGAKHAELDAEVPTDAAGALA
ncbi:hypothetical protein [Streptomyces sp. NPDC056264]|uniref:hypothetical protein n=1 Tax=Streptomyces sp. NPDC056264 TaxID=3345767 RepID=UPI003AAA6D10